MSKPKNPTQPKLSIVGSESAEPRQSLDDRILDPHAELCEIMSLINVTSAALPAMAGQNDLAEPQSVLWGARDRLSAALDELEGINTKVRALESAGVANG